VETEELTVRWMLSQSDRLWSCVPNQIGLATVTGRQASGSEQLVGKPVACCTPRTSGWSCYRALGLNERLLQWIQTIELQCMFQLSQVSKSGITVAVFWERLRQIFSVTFAVVRQHYFAVS
jgi:hypothetical protein